MKDNILAKVLKKMGIYQEGRLDIQFLSLVLILLSVGIVMLFSASYAYCYAQYGNSYHFIIRQAIFAVVGIIVMLVLSRIDCRVYRKFSVVLYIVSAIMLAVVLALPPMQEGMEHKRWLVIGSFSFQPSEIAKFAIILLFSHLIAKNYKRMGELKFIAKLIFLLAVICGLVVVETHLSATILILTIGVVLMIVGGMAVKYIVGGVIAAAGGVAVIVITGLVKYAMSRFEYWLDPWADATGKGYQTIQSLLAIGSGGLLGRGIGQSRQKYSWLPEPHNDFIFSIVCEELGLIGALVIICLFCALVWRGFKIAMHSPDKYSSLMAVGLTFQVALQASLNIMVVTNTIPNTGISLPFFSYGGTALLILLAEMGIVLSISRSSNLEKV
ncbi:MAG: putative lipid II flippase FtsW [Acutalibacteraceae bacterium]|nr:putative lipid II flippase FtsW [Acutalibacteraceae bacterium]